MQARGTEHYKLTLLDSPDRFFKHLFTSDGGGDVWSPISGSAPSLSIVPARRTASSRSGADIYVEF